MPEFTTKAGTLFFLVLAVSSAAVVRIETAHTSPAPHGYERVTGRAFFAVDPQHPRNREIVDITLAPRNGAGLVEFSADFEMLRPAAPAKGNQTILFEVVNRGKKGLLQMFNRSSEPTDPGDGLLMEQGYTIVWLGWQHDVPATPGLMRLHAPVAKGVTGRIRAEYTPAAPVDRFPLGDANHIPYKPISSREATLTVRKDIYGARTPIAPDAWRFENGTHVRLDSPAVPGHIYEVIYEAGDPVIAGLGCAGVRDLIAYLRQSEHANHAIGFGVSQSAMFLRAFLYEGFNQDERGKRVFDGVFSHVAGARRSTFQRFTQASRTAGPLRNASLSATEQPPFTDAELLARAAAAQVAPKMFATNSTYEYWGSAASLLHTEAGRLRDLSLPKNVRMYVFAGGQHGPAAFPPRAVAAVNLPNFNDYKWSVRALLESLRAWIVSGTEPPASIYPTLESGTLTSLDKYAFRTGEKPAKIHTPHLLDFGPDYRKKGIIGKEPPRVVRALQTLVPQAGTDGNDLGGIRMPEVECAIATYTGWNLRSEAVGAPGYLMGNTGSYLPFDLPKIQQRFPDKASYLSCVESAASSLVERKLLLQHDIPSLIDSASQHWSWRLETRAISSVQTQ